MTTTTGKLKVGLEFAGKTHIDFTMRAAMVKDTLEAGVEAPEGGLKFLLSGFSKQIIKLGDIPKENITGKFLENLYDVDLDVIQKAAQTLEKKLMMESQS